MQVSKRMRKEQIEAIFAKFCNNGDSQKFSVGVFWIFFWISSYFLGFLNDYFLDFFFIFLQLHVSEMVTKEQIKFDNNGVFRIFLKISDFVLKFFLDKLFLISFHFFFNCRSRRRWRKSKLKLFSQSLTTTGTERWVRRSSSSLWNQKRAEDDSDSNFSIFQKNGKDKELKRIPTLSIQIIPLFIRKHNFIFTIWQSETKRSAQNSLNGIQIYINVS